jgi:arylsulfatase
LTAYCNNLCGAQYFYVGADTPLAAGTHQVRIEFTYDGNGFGKGGQVGPTWTGSGSRSTPTKPLSPPTTPKE